MTECSVARTEFHPSQLASFDTFTLPHGSSGSFIQHWLTWAACVSAGFLPLEFFALISRHGSAEFDFLDLQPIMHELKRNSVGFLASGLNYVISIALMPELCGIFFLIGTL